jgi:CRP/FNR family transcriptional regulator, cyclic AMP receptor protein
MAVMQPFVLLQKCVSLAKVPLPHTMQDVSTVSQSVLDTWRKVPYLEEVSGAAVADLAAAAVRHVYPQGQMIFLEGEPNEGLYLVEEGTVKICRFAADGREHILHLVHPGDTFNDVAALDGGPNPACATAFNDVILWRVPRPELRRVAARHPELAWALIESIARRARYLVNVVQDLAMRNVKGRLARLLLEQAQAAEQGETMDALTQEEMASRLGTVREVVGRALRSLAAENIISMEKQHIVIVDRKRLEQTAEV